MPSSNLSDNNRVAFSEKNGEPEMKLSNQRHLFEISNEVTYLNCAYMSPLLHSVRAAGERGLRKRARPWGLKSTEFFEDSEILRESFARLLNATSDAIALVPSASYGLATAAANLSDRAGKNILVLHGQFPSNVYVWMEYVKRHGGELVTVKRGTGESWTAPLLKKMDPHVGIVAIPHCHWSDGSLVDLPAIRKKADEINAALVVDLSQSFGAYPFNLEEVRPDFLVTVGYKWLMGPYGLSYLYIAPQYRNGTPIEFNWINREGSENFSGLGTYPGGYQNGARRFDMGERSNPVSLPMAIAALEQIRQWTIPEIQATLRELTSQIEVGAKKLGLKPLSEKLRVGHLIGIELGYERCLTVAAKLAQENIFVSARGDSLRVSPHLHCTEEDISRFLRGLEKLI